MSTEKIVNISNANFYDKSTSINSPRSRSVIAKLNIKDKDLVFKNFTEFLKDNSDLASASKKKQLAAYDAAEEERKTLISKIRDERYALKGQSNLADSTIPKDVSRSKSANRNLLNNSALSNKAIHPESDVVVKKHQKEINTFLKGEFLSEFKKADKIQILDDRKEVQVQEQFKLLKKHKKNILNRILKENKNEPEIVALIESKIEEVDQMNLQYEKYDDPAFVLENLENSVRIEVTKLRKIIDQGRQMKHSIEWMTKKEMLLKKLRNKDVKLTNSVNEARQKRFEKLMDKSKVKIERQVINKSRRTVGMSMKKEKIINEIDELERKRREFETLKAMTIRKDLSFEEQKKLEDVLVDA